MGTKDGLAQLEVISATFSGTNLQVGASQIDSTELGAGAASGTVVSLEFPVAYTGSPVKGNTAIQYGSATPVGYAANTVVSFGKAFAAAPRVIVTTIGSVATSPYVAGVSAGSFLLAGGSNIAHSWLAIGSGRI